MEQSAGYDRWLTCAVFGDYESFLEIAFAVNILYGAWEDIRARLAARSLDGTAFLANFAQVIDDNTAGAYGDLVGKAKRVRNRFTRWGRIISFTIAALIAAGLFWFPSALSVPAWGKSLIALSILAFPIVMLFMVVVDWYIRLRARLTAGDGAMAKAVPNPDTVSVGVERLLEKDALEDDGPRH